MKRWLAALMLVIVVSLNPSSLALADHGDPIWACPDSFEPHHVHDHTHGDHPHIGSDTDRNEDGWLCVKHLPNGKHLHIDNNKPKKS